VKIRCLADQSLCINKPPACGDTAPQTGGHYPPAKCNQ
jgi:hypothetical protein